ncbi:PIG-L family deacetylase [Arthrobacter sp.]|uniref:PIG-L family deacetylase n=1 Tax=Arthrobacter sp. TaxID=1667 RepID=UPI003A8D0841
MVTFSHDDAGTPESTWADAGIGQLPGLAAGVVPGDGERLIVLAAHPDDESLGAAGLIHSALHSGATVEVVICSAGEASHPRSPTYTPTQLAALRRGELDTALGRLREGAPDPRRLSWCHLGLPDGDLAANAGALDEALAAVVDGPADGPSARPSTGRTVIAAPYRLDAHADHDAVGSAAARLATRKQLGLLEFPIWYWHWGTPERTEWREWQTLRLDASAREAKRAALGAHRSQILPLSSAPGDEVLLSGAFQRHFLRPTETFRWTAPAPRDSTSAARIFDDLYRRRPDPWDYLGSAYEHRKRAVTLASLPRPRYDFAIEAGCSIGVLTSALAERCSHVLGIDASQVAIDAASDRVRLAENVGLLRADLPAGWPQQDPGTVDLVVLSEIGYFLSRDECRTLLDVVSRTLCPGGDLLLCHWLHPIDGWELDGSQVHDIARSLGWKRMVEHREEDFLLEVLRAPGGSGG